MPLFFRIFNCRNLKLRFVSRLKSPKAAIVRFVSCTNFLHKENSISFRKRKLECMTHVVAQIGEQMCLETNFQYEFSFLGRFGQSGLQRKKIQTAISVLLLRPVFLCFQWQNIYIFLNTLASPLKSYII